MRKATKIIISFAVVLIAGLNFIVPAFAQDPFTSIAIGGFGGASGAGLFGSMAGMSGINIGWSSSGSDPLDAMWNVLNPDHVYFSGEKHEATGIDEDVWDYITVDIGDWLDAQSDFIINFAQTNNVTDNSSGTITGYQRYADYEFTRGSYGPSLGVAAEGGVYSVGNVSLSIDSYKGPAGYYNYTLVKNDGTRTQSWTNFGTDFIGSNVVLHKNSFGQVYFARELNGNIKDYFLVGDNMIQPATSTNWTSDTVNTSVFDGWENARVKIPHSISGLTTGWTIPDFTNAINDLWNQNLQGQIVIEDTDQPVPPPPPVPTTPLGDVPFDNWINLWGQGINEQLENQSDALYFIGSAGEDAVEELESIDTSIQDLGETAESIDINIGVAVEELESIDTNIQDLGETAESIDTNIGVAVEELESIDTNIQDLGETAESIDTNIGVGNGILGGIRSLAQSAVNYLEGIAEHVGELVEEIVEGTETLIAGILNQIPQAFGVIFGPIKQASSIWHYVVEWIQSIGAPFQFIWSMASGTSYYVILPVYASLAAAVVLAFFKRFGR